MSDYVEGPAVARLAGRTLSRRTLVQAAASAGLAAGAGRYLTRQEAAAAAAPEGRIVISLNAEPSTLEW